jgi:hypothetical protein
MSERMTWTRVMLRRKEAGKRLTRHRDQESPVQQQHDSNDAEGHPFSR